MSKKNILLTSVKVSPMLLKTTHLYQLLLLLSERPRILRHCLQVPFGTSGFEGPQRQMLGVSFQQVGGTDHCDLMELVEGEGEKKG